MNEPVSKIVVFGSPIALVACHFGLRTKPDTKRFGHGTAVSVIILTNAVCAVVFGDVGYY